MSTVIESYRSYLDGLQDGLPDHPERIPHLPPEAARSALRFLLEAACQAQGALSIAVGRCALARIEKSWIGPRLLEVGEQSLDLGNYWEFVRFLEVCCVVDSVVADQLVATGLESTSPEIREAAGDFQGQSEEIGDELRALCCEPPWVLGDDLKAISADPPFSNPKDELLTALSGLSEPLTGWDVSVEEECLGVSSVSRGDAYLFDGQLMLILRLHSSGRLAHEALYPSSGNWIADGLGVCKTRQELVDEVSRLISDFSPSDA